MKPITPESVVQTWVIYGPSGGGKTSLLSTAPRPAILDTNKGVLSIAGRVGLEHVQSEPMNEFRDLERALGNFKGTGKQDWRKKFDTIGFDHFDDIQAIIMEELGRKRAKIAKEKGDTRRQDMDESEQKDWGVMATRLKRILRGFKTVPIHKVLICGQMDDRETGMMVPSLQGQMRAALPYFVDHVLYLRVGKGGVRYLHLDEAPEKWFAKTRAWWLTPEQRKIKVDLNDTKTLTKLFDLIAAGPKGVVKRGTTSAR
jgi:hypothetical protein